MNGCYVSENKVSPLHRIVCSLLYNYELILAPNAFPKHRNHRIAVNVLYLLLVFFPSSLLPFFPSFFFSLLMDLIRSSFFSPFSRNTEVLLFPPRRPPPGAFQFGCCPRGKQITRRRRWEQINKTPLHQHLPGIRRQIRPYLPGIKPNPPT